MSLKVREKRMREREIEKKDGREGIVKIPGRKGRKKVTIYDPT